MSKIIRGSDLGADRYKYDFGVCSYGNGWAQLDTGQDASYFGTWINPDKLRILCYCEGDLTIMECDSSEDLASEVARIKTWNIEQGHGFGGIDPGFNPDLKSRFVSMGLGEFLHLDAQEQR